MATDPRSSTLELDLTPNADQAGELHGQAPSTPVRHYLAISPPKSLFHFSVRSGLELHGYYKGEPATLVTLKASFVPKEQARPIKWAAITAYFNSEETGTKSEPIKVEAFALGQPTVKVMCSVESDEVRKSIKANLGVDQFASAGGEASYEHEASKEKKYAATSQGSGVPPNLTLAIILLRANNTKFIGSVQVDIKVDWRYNVEQWCTPFKQFKKWGCVGRHKVYTPSEGNKMEAPENVEIGKMENLTKNGKELMEGLVKIEMPVEYHYQK